MLATAFGTYRLVRDGRFHGTHVVRGTQTGGTRAGSTRVRGTQNGGSQAGGGAQGRPENAEQPSLLADTAAAHQLGERATLLQFSSAFCAPCRATRRILADVAEVVPGVTHVEIDAEHHLDLVRRLGIVRTPTTLILDHHGHEVSRASGAPRKDEVLATLSRAIEV